MKLDARVYGEKLLNSRGLVGGEVVQDDVDLLTPWLAGDHGAEESDELLAGVPRSGLADDRAGLGVQRCVQGERPFTDIFETMALRSAGRHRQHRIPAVESLDGGFLVEAEYDCVLGRVQVEGDDVGCLGLEVGIIGSHVALEAMWLETSSRPHPGHPHVRHSQVTRHLAAAPLGASVGRRLAGGTENASLQLVGIGGRSATQMSSVKTIQALGHETPSPALDELLATVKLVLDGGVREPVRQEQDHPGTHHVFSTQRSCSTAGLEFRTFGLGENDWTS